MSQYESPGYDADEPLGGLKVQRRKGASVSVFNAAVCLFVKVISIREISLSLWPPSNLQFLVITQSPAEILNYH